MEVIYNPEFQGNDKPVVVLDEIRLNEGNRPDEAYVKDTGIFKVKFKIWSGDYYPNVVSPGRTDVERKKFNTKEGKEETENVRYQDVTLDLDGDTDPFREGTPQVESISGAIGVGYQVMVGKYGLNLRQFINHIKEDGEHNWNCGTCIRRCRREVSLINERGITEDENYHYVCSLLNFTVDDNWWKARQNSRGDDVNADRNQQYLLSNSFAEGLGYNLDQCPWHDKNFKRNNGLGWFREKPKPFFPVQIKEVDGKKKHYIEFDKFFFDITWVFEVRKKVVKVVREIAEHREGLNETQSRKLADILLSNKMDQTLRRLAIDEFANMKGGE